MAILSDLGRMAPSVQPGRTLASIARPLNPGEYVQNADGSRSTERTHTVQMPGGWANVPSLWSLGGRIVDAGQMPDDMLAILAQRYEQATGQVFRRHRMWRPSVAGAEMRSEAGGAASGYGRYQAGRGR